MLVSNTQHLTCLSIILGQYQLLCLAVSAMNPIACLEIALR